MQSKTLITLALAGAMTTGCLSEDDPNRRAKIGAVTGAIAGAVIGNNVGDGSSTNRFVGAIIGGLAGGAIGNYMDKQARELELALEDELRAEYVTLERLDRVGTGFTFIVAGIGLNGKAFDDPGNIVPQLEFTAAADLEHILGDRPIRDDGIGERAAVAIGHAGKPVG